MNPYRLRVTRNSGKWSVRLYLNRTPIRVCEYRWGWLAQRRSEQLAKEYGVVPVWGVDDMVVSS